MKVLVIDDEPEALKQIENALCSTKAPDGAPFEVRTARDHAAGMDLLDEHRFDLVIIDMYMAEEDEGLGILRRLVDKSPITIVLTAYPSIPNCVASMRSGAWDYIEKVPEDGSDPYENLLKSVREACDDRLSNPEAGRPTADTRWIHENMSDLMKNYPGEVVAVLDQEVVGHHASFSELSRSIKQDFLLAKPTLISIPDTRVDAIE